MRFATAAGLCAALVAAPAEGPADAPPRRNPPLGRSIGQPEARPPATGDWHLGAEVVTDVPLQVGGRLSLEAPHRIRLATSFGTLPAAYFDVVNGILVSAGAWSEATAAMMRDVLAWSLVWRLRAGWRPLPRYGFYFEAGYAMIALGGSRQTRDVIEQVTGRHADPQLVGARYFEVIAMLHMADIEVGWEWLLLGDRLVLRTAVGFVATMAANTHVSPRGMSANAAAATAFARGAEASLDDSFRSSVFVPLLTVGAGYRFF